MSTIQIAIIKADSDNDPVKNHDWIETIFYDFFDNKTYCLHFFDAVAGTLPEPNQFDVYLITGSRYAVYQSDAWVSRLIQYVRDNNFPKLIGICFGHQLIALARGGNVQHLGWNLGLGKITQNSQPSWLDRPIPIGPYRFNHQDHVLTLPAGYENIASNEQCLHAMYQFNNCVLGIQFHPEFSKAFHHRVLTRIHNNGHFDAQEHHDIEQDILADCQGQQLLSVLAAFVRY